MNIDSYKIATFDRTNYSNISCATCKYSRTNTGKQCVKNIHRECSGNADLRIGFEYNCWEPIGSPIQKSVNQILPDNLFEV